MFSFEEAYCGLEFDDWVNVVEFITTEVPKMVGNPNFEQAITAVLTFRSMRGECSDLGIEELSGFFTGDSEEASAEILLPMINIFRGLKTTGKVYVLAREEAQIAEAMGIDGSRVRVVSPQELYDRFIEEGYAEGEDGYTWVDEDKVPTKDSEDVPGVDNTEEEDEYTWIDEEKLSDKDSEDVPDGDLTEGEEDNDGYVWEDGDVLEKDNAEEVSGEPNDGEEYAWEDAGALERGEEDEGDRSGVEEQQDSSKENNEDLSADERLNKIHKEFRTFCEDSISALKSLYTTMFAPGYELSIPVGVITSSGVYSIKGISRSKTLRDSSGAAMNSAYRLEDTGRLLAVGDYISKKLGYREALYSDSKPVRSVKNIARELYNGYFQGNFREPLYFPLKMLEFAYGRVAPSGDDQNSLNTYTKQSDVKSFEAYWNKGCSI